MNGFLRNFLRNEWKWLMGLAVAGIVGFSGLKTTVSSIVQTTEKLTEKMIIVETFKAVQEKQNQFIEKKLDDIDKKIDRILRK